VHLVYRSSYPVIFNIYNFAENFFTLDFQNFSPVNCTPLLPNDNVTFMINPDMALFKDIKVNKEGKSSCTFEDCPNSPTANIVQTFAGSNKVWIEAFERVFNKMMAHGTDNLHDVQ